MGSEILVPPTRPTLALLSEGVAGSGYKLLPKSWPGVANSVFVTSALSSFSGSRRAGDDARRTARPLKVEFSSFFCVVCVSSRFQYSIQ